MSGFVSNNLSPNHEANKFLGMGFESSTTMDVNCGGIGGEIVVTEGFCLVKRKKLRGMLCMKLLVVTVVSKVGVLVDIIAVKTKLPCTSKLG
ncbi:hypothetical protein V6N11_047974 [Hibiscus sabdariffa]|uniref:Uncharacterized protein n=2 Tax=Hibiscus sabdariffa TaxID=183260 RepID=A0ABR2NXI9_9ROSI